ncbi:MAG: hypothetical protein V3S31_01340, partial [Dehalococcoidia bacterium]
PLWEELATTEGRGTLRAHVELAIYYEHHVRDFARAARVVERAFAHVNGTLDPWDRAGATAWRSALEHRKSRLQRRLATPPA